MAQGRSIVTAVAVLIRISLALGFLAFVTGLVGTIVAVVAVRTGNVTRVDLPVYPLAIRVPAEDTVSLIRRDLEEVSVQRRPSSKFSFEA